MLNLIGHKALVTGASRGLGKAIATRLSELGCSVVLLARDEVLLQRNLQQLSSISPQQKHSYIKCDLANLYIKADTNHQHLVDALQDISILVNCAGVTNHKLLPKLSNEEIISTINTNLTSPIILSKMAFKPLLQSSKKFDNFVPTILNISSILALNDTSVPGTAVYSASKKGLLGFTSALAAEFKGKIRVNSILPGLIEETDMGKSAHIDNVEEVSLKDVVDASIEVIGDQNANGEHTIIAHEEKV